jgi:hypothetical protein
MDKRRKTGCKENGFSKIDFLEEKLGIYSNQINEKIENIESLFLAQSNKQEEKMLRLSTNKNDNSFSNMQEPIQSRFSLFDQASNMAVKYSFSKTETILIPRQIELKQKKHNTLRSYGLNKSNKSVDEHLDPEELELVLPIESRIDFLEKKLDAVLQNTNEKINTIERLLQHFSKQDLNYKHQRIIKEYQDFSHFDKNKTLRKCDEFLNLLLMNKPQNSPDTNKDEDLMITSSEPTVRLSILDLIQIGQLFENNELSTKLNDFVLANLNSDQLKEVLEIFMKNYDEVKYSSIFLYLIEHRVKWINEYCNNKPEFSWKMPNPVFVDEQNDIYIIDVIREFLQSDSQILEYNCGISLKFARKIVTDFFWSPKKILSGFVSYEQKGYSMNMEIDGVGHNTKAYKYFGLKLLKYKSDKQFFVDIGYYD